MDKPPLPALKNYKKCTGPAIRCLAEEGLTLPQIEQWFGKDCKDFKRDYDIGRSICRRRVLQKQMAALDKGVAVAIIWMGKQILDQTDKPPDKKGAAEVQKLKFETV